MGSAPKATAKQWSRRLSSVSLCRRLAHEADVIEGGAAERLNRGCFCITLDRPSLAEALNREVDSPYFAERLSETHPSLFSNVATFVSAETLAEMADVVHAVEAAARLPCYRDAAL